MTNWRLSLVAFGAVMLLAPAANAQPLPVKTVEFDSPSVGRKMKYSIVLPEKYEKTTDRFPVLYLLHGLTSAYTQWPRQGVPEYARAYDLIVVMADGGNSWYVNWSKSDEGQKNNSEDAIVSGLSTGRVYVRTIGVDGPAIDLHGEAGSRRAVMGGSLPAGPMTLTARIAHASGQECVWIERGREVRVTRLRSDDEDVALETNAVAGDWYSVVVRSHRRPTAFGNAIYITR